MKEKIIKNIKNYCKTNILFLTFVVTSLINEILLRSFSVKNVFEIKPVLADIAVILIIASLGYLFKPKNRFKYYLCWAIFFTVICVVNSVYYNNFLSFTSFSLLATSIQAIGVSDAIVQNVMEAKDFIYIIQILILIIVHSSLKRKNYYQGIIQNAKVYLLNTLIVGVIFVGLFISSLSSLDIGRFGKQWNREYVVMKFGLYLYQFNDLVISIKPQISPLFGYDEHAKMFREYYDNKDMTHEDNKYTNILEGKNVLVIHAESIQKFTMDAKFNGEEVTPTLNKLAREGMFFTNFYAQDSVGTSSDTEFTFNTSLMPASSGTVFVNYYDREYLTIPKLLKEKGYYTFSMHANNCTFWNRNVAHASLGYDRFYCYNKDFELDEMLGLGLSDKSFFRQVVPKIKEINENNEKFYGILIMLTNHTPFAAADTVDFEVNYKYEKEIEDDEIKLDEIENIDNETNIEEDTKKTEEVVAPYLEGTTIGNYIKTVHYADEALGQLIDDLDKEGLLDNLVIIIYGDHDAKLKKAEFNRYYNYDPYTDSILSKDDPNYTTIDNYFIELNRKVPLIIWTKDEDIQKKLNTEVTEVMGMYDVLPTIGNMLNISSKYSLGNDIFNTKNNIVVFPNGDWMTDKLYYLGQKEEWKLIDNDETISLDYINKGIEHANEVISISDAIITYDLIKKTRESEDIVNNK